MNLQKVLNTIYVNLFLFLFFFLFFYVKLNKELHFFIAFFDEKKKKFESLFNCIFSLICGEDSNLISSPFGFCFVYSV